MLEQQHGTVLAVGYVCASQVSSVCEPMEVEEDCTEEEQQSKKLKRENVFVDVLNKLGVYSLSHIHVINEKPVNVYFDGLAILFQDQSSK